MFLRQLWLRDFRSYVEADVTFAPGLTVLVGENGAGKTNVLEAASWLSTLRSFRGVPSEGMVRLGAAAAVVRGEVVTQGREVLIESEIQPSGRGRVLVNKQVLAKTRQLRDVLRVSIFSPDDLVLVKGGPSERRGWLDDLFVALHPRNDALVAEVDRILRQRNALLKQTNGRLTEEIAFTLDVWDAKLAASGSALAVARVALLEQLVPVLTQAYADIADRPAPVAASYRPSWDGALDALDDALARGRSDDVRRGLTLVGPHRDDVQLEIEGRPSRTHASQGEQRTLALALRLAGHRLWTDAFETAPLLLLDDVFSELDPIRSDALIRTLPPGQVLLASAGIVPPSAAVESVVRVSRPVANSAGVDAELGSRLLSSVDSSGETVDKFSAQSREIA